MARLADSDARMAGDSGAAQPYDLRLVTAALTLWAGVLAGLLSPLPVGLIGCVSAAVMASAVAARLRADRRRAAAVAVACLVVGFALGATRVISVWQGPVPALAAAGAYVAIEGVITKQPVLRTNTVPADPGEANNAGEKATADTPAGSAVYTVGRMRVEQVTGRGIAHRIRTPMLVVAGDPSWASLLPGQRVRTAGLLRPADASGDVAAVLRASDGPTLIGGPSLSSWATEPFRAGLRASVADTVPDARGLLPGLVVGDESRMSDSLREDMRLTGLAHLTAVSGSNVALVVLVVVGAARWLGVRAFGLPILAVLCVIGFVFLVRPDPSVLRAATMGVVAVTGLVVTGRRRSLPTLAAAVIVLLLVDPWLARSLGFVLSVLATAGILIFAPAWWRALWWLPRPLGLAVAVPLAAQVACTPMVVAASGELSVASLPANMLAGPAVAPATVLGLAAAVVSPVLPDVATAVGWLAAWPAWWIAGVARWFADQPGAVLGWSPGPAGVVLAVALAVVAALAVPVALRRPVVTAAAACVLVAGLLKTVPTPGWPPPGWLVVACDVGQGDAFVLRAAARSAVVVDAGPQPRAVRRCLDSLGIVDVPMLVLTHFHADHVEGLAGVLTGRHVGGALVSPRADPAVAAEEVSSSLADAGVPVDVAQVGQRHAIGESVRLEVLWPRRFVDSTESASNNASVVLAASVGGTDLLLTGDLEPAAQRALLRENPELSADVLKIAHHGSARQEQDLLTGVNAEIALIGVGENRYGHPSRVTLDELRDAGVQTYRTDRDGSVALVRRPDGELEVVGGGPRVGNSQGR